MSFQTDILVSLTLPLNLSAQAHASLIAEIQRTIQLAQFKLRTEFSRALSANETYTFVVAAAHGSIHQLDELITSLVAIVERGHRTQNTEALLGFSITSETHIGRTTNQSLPVFRG